MGKWDSRKYKAAWGLTWLLTALFVLPAMASLILLFFKMSFTIELLPAMYYISSITLIWAAYFGANTAVHFAHKEKPDDGTGGQPPDTDR